MTDASVEKGLAWFTVCHALVIGRAKAMQEAKTNKPTGSAYNRLIGP
jgi:hypothetical protein